MQTHKETQKNMKQAEQLLEDWLPHFYVNRVLGKLKMEDTPSNRFTVRSVRYGRAKDEVIYLALVELADERKKAHEKIGEIVNS